MRITQRVKKFLTGLEGDNVGTKTNLARLLTEGRLGGSGSIIALAVDQGFSDGPALSFAQNPRSYDPHYHFQLAVDGQVSALAAPLGVLESGADTFAGTVPLILKMNSPGTQSTHYTQGISGGITASVSDALRLGCAAIGCTVSSESDSSYEEIRALIEEAKASGLAVIIWSHPVGGNFSVEGETALDTVAHGAHMAALLGAHMVCVKVPTNHLEDQERKLFYAKHGISMHTVSDRVRHVRQACFNGRRMVLFSLSDKESDEEMLEEIRGIRDGGANGCILGRVSFQRPFDDGLEMLDQVIKVYQGKA
jgi:class I fructose-bisphosphate aldolase